MYYTSWKQRLAVEKKLKEKWLKQRNDLTEDSGIYVLTRQDEKGFIYAYVGQAKHILSRLAEHLSGYKQHIDLSLKKHGLFSETNINGWLIDAIHYCPENQLDEFETHYIEQYAKLGYQMRNKTGGSQGVGKFAIAENKSPKGYYDGKRQGYEDCRKYVKTMFEKYLEYNAKDGKIAERKKEEFKEFLC